MNGPRKKIKSLVSQATSIKGVAKATGNKTVTVTKGNRQSFGKPGSKTLSYGVDKKNNTTSMSIKKTGLLGNQKVKKTTFNSNDKPIEYSETLNKRNGKSIEKKYKFKCGGKK